MDGSPELGEDLSIYNLYLFEISQHKPLATMAATKFQGWLGKDESSVKGNMVWGDFEPKKWTEDDVDIEISHCGICGSDLHMLSSGWGPTPYRTPSL